MAKRSRVYMNPKQKTFLRTVAPLVVFMGGRGTGKTTTIAAATTRNVQQMPRGKTFLSSTTYAQLLTKTLPEITKFWERVGFREGLHYVVGCKPPRDFLKPLAAPRKYQNVISFGNGYTIELLSMDRPDLARGGSYDAGDIDEAALVKKPALEQVIIPAVRGNRDRFRKVPTHHQVRLYTSVPRRPSGQYIWNYQELAQLRPKDFAFVEATSADNLVVLGRDFIDRMRAILDPVEFAIEIMNERVMRLPDGFYSAFDPERHAHINTYTYDEGDRGITVTGTDRDRDRKKAIDLTVDFGGKINVGLAAQFDGKTIRFLREFYVKAVDGKLPELVTKFCDQYENHEHKFVRIFGEPRGHDRQSDGAPYYARMVTYFAKRGWYAEVKARKTAESHLTRHTFITDLFNEQDKYYPKIRINEVHCPNFVVVLQTTGIKDDFTKDKKMEKDPNFPQERAPHFSDAFDYYLTQLLAHLLGLSTPSGGGEAGAY